MSHFNTSFKVIQGIKVNNFVNLSTTVMIAPWPFGVRGNPEIRSEEMHQNGRVGMASG
jgi:hypothetical protein